MKIISCKLWKSFAIILLPFVLGLGIFVTDSHAGEWRVSPTRVDFSKGSKSSVITVGNVSEELITISVDALEWAQDDEGIDQYTPTSDLVFFPKMLVIKPGESRVIRLGVRTPAVKTEKSYRLFLKEQPSPTAAKDGTVAVVMQFAIPVFSKPLQEQFAGTFEDVAYEKGVLDILLRNTGNVFFRINDVKFSGKNSSGEEILQEELKGWYLLTGSARNFSIDLPQDLCVVIQSLDVLVNTDHGPLTTKIELNQDMCSSMQ